MAFRLIFDAEAESDLAEIESYLSQRSPTGAANVLADIWTALQLLPDHPLMGRRSEDGAFRLRVTRRYRYTVAYEVVGEEIRVRAIYHPRENRPV